MVKSYNLKVDRDYIEAEVLSIPNPTHRAFLATLFLTGARISEVVGNLKGSDVSVRDGICYAHLITLKKRKPHVGLPREVPIMPTETLYPVFWNYAKERPGVLFSFTRQWGWCIVKKYMILYFPHWFRHARSTVLMREIDNFNLADLKTFHNWSSIAMADVYVQGELKTIVNKMKKK